MRILRYRFLPALAVLCLASAALPAQEAAGLYGQIGSVGGLSPFSRYISVELAVGVQSGPFTLAFVPRLIAGTTQFDLHVAPQLLVQAGLVYLQAGWAFEVLDTTDDYQIIDFGPGGGIGVRVELGSVSGGALVLDTGYEVFFALEPDAGVPSTVGLAPPNALEDLLDFATSVSVPYSLLRVGLLYTLGP